VLVISTTVAAAMGGYRTAKLVEKYGAETSVQPFQDDITRDYAGKHDLKYAFGNCALMIPNLRTVRRNQARW